MNHTSRGKHKGRARCALGARVHWPCLHEKTKCDEISRRHLFWEERDKRGAETRKIETTPLHSTTKLTAEEENIRAHDFQEKTALLLSSMAPHGHSHSHSDRNEPPSAAGKILETAVLGGAVASAVALGVRLGLFDVLGSMSSEGRPATAKNVAAKAECKERYVEEWLSAMACAGLVEITPQDTFWMNEDQLKQLTNESGNMMLHFCQYLPQMIKPLDKLEDAFKKDGRYGLEYSDFEGFYELNKKLAPHRHNHTLIPEYVPCIVMKERLAEGGLHVLDIGCAGGYQLLEFAKAYPKCSFTGIDIGGDAIRIANETKATEKITNAEFHIMDATCLSEKWNGRFDLIVTFGVVHDLTRPDLCLAGVHRLLKEGGLFAMLEPGSEASIYETKHSSPMAALHYSMSLLHGLPISSNGPGALGVGPMSFGRYADGFIEKAGFEKDNVKKVKPSFFPMATLYMCRK